MLIVRQRLVNVLDHKAFFFISTLENILSIPEFKHKFISHSNNKLSIEEAVKAPGSRIDKKSTLGLFLRLSLLGHYYDYYHPQEREAAERFQNKMRDDFSS